MTCTCIQIHVPFPLFMSEQHNMFVPEVCPVDVHLHVHVHVYNFVCTSTFCIHVYMYM